MAARAIWKGVLCLDELEVPVKLYSAVQDHTIRFHLLHDQDQTRIKQRLVNPRTQREIPYSEAHKGYEVERGTFVMLDKEELQSLEPEPSRDIQITRFVDPGEIHHQWYDRPYYLGPDGEDTGDYFALAEALEKEQKEGVARWAMRKKEYLGSLRSRNGYLVLTTLRFANQVITADSLEPPEGREPAKQELQMAEQLVGALQTDFDPSAYRDEYRDAVMQLIKAKARGEEVETEEYEEPEENDSLAESLRASLAGIK